MATTRLISLHVNKGKTVAQCLTDRTDYSKNPEKTNGGELVTAHECDRATVDAEFLFSKRQYHTITGREQKNDVIAYMIRQSFKPGEVTPEEANAIGCELADRFLKGKHAYIVATHIDKAHIHNHVIFNSTSLDCKRKFRDFLGSGRAIGRLSDTICLQHGLSIIENPKRGKKSYNKWLGDRATISHRELLRIAVDDALLKEPVDLEMLLKLLADAGYEIKRGKNIALKGKEQERFVRLSSLGEGYSEDEICAVLAGSKTHTPRKKRDILVPKKNTLLIDIQAKLDAGKGQSYVNWATNFNLKQMAQTVNYLTEHKLLDYSELTTKTTAATDRFNTLSAQIKAAETRMVEIVVLKTHIINYSKTRDVYAAYRQAGYSKKFLAEHEGDIILHKAAKAAFDELGVKKLPTVKSLQTEYAALLFEKKKAYSEYRSTRNEMKELLIHKNNIDRILGYKEHEADKKKEHDRQ